MLPLQQENALQLGLKRFPNQTNIFNTRQLETIGPIPNANHLNMNEVPWQEQVLTDGYTGALSWLITQTKPEGGKYLHPLFEPPTHGLSDIRSLPIDALCKRGK